MKSCSCEGEGVDDASGASAVDNLFGTSASMSVLLYNINSCSPNILPSLSYQLTPHIARSTAPLRLTTTCAGPCTCVALHTALFFLSFCFPVKQLARYARPQLPLHYTHHAYPCTKSRRPHMHTHACFFVGRSGARVPDHAHVPAR